MGRGVHRSGFVAVIGKPNVGKSTIMNSLIGNKLSIVTPRPQTTRVNVLGILSDESYQVIFIDTPGIHNPRRLLDKYMVRKAKESLIEADIILYVIEASGFDRDDRITADLLREVEKPVILVINKIDKVKKGVILPLIDQVSRIHRFVEVIPVSAVKGDNMDLLKEKIIEFLPEGPKYYPEDHLSDRNERFFVGEIIREEVMNQLRDELPHTVAVKVEDMKDRSEKLSYINAVIYVEKPSQKKIIIGKNGEQIKRIGESSRKQLERFLGRKVYLELWVKVWESWRKDPSALKELGYR